MPGKIPYYKRTKYLAPAYKCCSGNGVKTFDGKTCDPKYLDPNSAACSSSVNPLIYILIIVFIIIFGVGAVTRMNNSDDGSIVDNSLKK